MSKTIRKTLTTRLVLLALLPVIAAGFFAQAFLDKVLTREINDGNTVLVGNLADQVNNFLSIPLDLLDHVVVVLEAGSILPHEQVDSFLETLIRSHDYIEVLQVLDQEGHIIHLAPAAPDQLGLNMAYQPFYTQVQGRSEPYWSPTFISSQTSHPTLTVSRAFTGGVVVCQLSLEQLSLIAVRSAAGHPGVLPLVVDSQGIVIASIDQAQVDRRQNVGNLMAVQLGRAGSDTILVEEYGGRRKFAAVSMLPATGWVVVSYQDYAELMAPVRNLQLLFGLGTLLTALVVMSLILRGLDRTLSPLAVLVKNVELITSGDYRFRQQPSGYREIDTLAEHVLIMSDAVRNREEMLRHSEERFRQLVETLTEGLNVIDAAGVIIYANRRFAELVGRPDDALIGRRLTDFVDDANRDILLAQLAKRPQGVNESYEVCYRWPDGTLHPVLVSPKSIFDQAGNYEGCFAVITDLSQVKEAEEALRESEAKFRELAALLPQAIFELDLAGNFTYANLFGYEATGYTPEDMAAGLNVMQLVKPADHGRLQRNIGLILAGAKKDPSEYALIRKDGSTFVALINTRPIMQKQRPVGLRGIVVDISERKRMEEALLASERSYRTLAENLPGIVYRLHAGSERRLQLFTRNSEAFFGSEIDSIEKMIHPEDRARVVGQIRESLASKQGFVIEYRLVTADGNVKQCLENGQPVYDDHGQLVSIDGVIQDITGRKQSEKQLQHLFAAIEHAAEDVMITDAAGVIEYVNPAFEKVTGYRRDEVIGRKPDFLNSGRHDQDFFARMWQTLQAGQVWAGRITNQQKNGRLIEQDATISPIWDDAGMISGYVSVMRDVTEQVQLATQLRQAQKMEAIGTLAGGIAHDFNNILSAIIGYSELAQMKLPAASPAMADLGEVFKAGNRAARLVQQILAFSRKSAHELQPLQLDLVVKEVLRLLRATIPSTIEIRQQISSGMMVMADPTQVHQVLMNLCTNAYQAMEDTGGVLTVSLEEAILEGASPGNTASLGPGVYARLVVSDTGLGIGRENIDRIFEPYFTTKEQGKGTGLGLSVVHGIIAGHGGEISVASEPGKGTVFTMYLPAITEVKTPTEAAAETIPGGTEKILCVDDEPAVVQMNKQVLERLGYTVETRTGSRDALECFRQNPGGFDLVITDMTMPSMSGDALARELMRLRPDIPVILATGFSEKIDAATAEASGIRGYLEKPFLYRDLAILIRRILD